MRANMMTMNVPKIFKLAPVEREDEMERRLKEELRISSDAPITAIPYEYVGADIRQLYPNNDLNVKNYQDWYKLTPAYSIAFAGKTPIVHLK